MTKSGAWYVNAKKPANSRQTDTHKKHVNPLNLQDKESLYTIQKAAITLKINVPISSAKIFFPSIPVYA